MKLNEKLRNDQTKEEYSFGIMLSDLRLAFRQLSKSPGFAIIAVLTLAVGIGASTAIYSALRALVIHPFDYPESDSLVHVWSGESWPLSPADFLDLHEQSSSFETFGVYNPQSFNVGEENAQAVSGMSCTAGVLATFGVRPQLGRWLEETDDVKNAPPVAVISHGLWQNVFGGDLDLIGKSIRLNGGDVTVVGIMPSKFELAGPWLRGSDCKVWLPMSLEDNKETRGSHWLNGVARLNSDASVGNADAELKSIGMRLSELYPDSNSNKKFLVNSLHYEMTKDLSDQVWLLFAAVVMVLLVACANVASMLLARSAKRQGEYGVRLALGATRGNIMRILLSESLVLAFLGALLGLGIAYGGIEVLKSISPVNEARKAAMAIDGSVLQFSLVASIFTALLAGMPPVFATVKTSIATVIRQDARGTVGSRSRHYMLRGLIIAQVACAFVLANGAVLFATSYFKVLEENKIMDTENVVSVKLTLQGDLYGENEDRVRFWERIVDRIKPLPGVLSVGLTSKMPLEGGSNTNGLVNDEVYDPSQQRIQIERSSITEGYFKAMGVTLLQGRNLGAEDIVSEGGVQGVVVNAAMVEKAWPDKDPIGEVIRGNNPGDPWFTATVVGVVEGVKQWSATAEIKPEMYLTPKGHWGNKVYIIVRSSRSASSLGPIIREELAKLDREVAVESVRTLRQVVLESTQGERALAGLVNFFMATALGLVGVGIYGTLSYHILQRTQEFGVRRAVGALRNDIFRMVLKQGGAWIAIGLAIGLGGIFALSKILTSIVYDMEGLSFQPLALAALVVAASAFVACWLPARRAANIEPLEALRDD